MRLQGGDREGFMYGKKLKNDNSSEYANENHAKGVHFAFSDRITQNPQTRLRLPMHVWQVCM